MIHPALQFAAVALLYWQWFGLTAAIVAVIAYWAAQSIGSFLVVSVFSEDRVLAALRAKLFLLLAAFLVAAGFIHG